MCGQTSGLSYTTYTTGLILCSVFLFSRYCWTEEDDFCADTVQERRTVADTFQESLTRAAGVETLPRSDIIQEVENCLVNTCGGCTEAGTK